MQTAACQSGCRSGGAEVYGREVVAHLAGVVAADDGVALAELPQVVAAPALDRCIVEECTGSVAARRNRNCGTSCTEVDGGKVVAHLAWFVATIRRVTEAEVAATVLPPALDGPVVEQHTRDGVVEGQRGCGSSGAEFDRREIVAHLIRVVATVGGVSESELALAVVPPALDAAIVEDRAHVVVVGRERERSTSGAEIDRREVVPHLVRSIATVGEVALSETARRPAPPALDRAGDQQRTGVVGAGDDRSSGQAGPEGYGREVRSHLVGGVASVVGVAKAQLAATVVSPALHGPVGEQNTRVVVAGCQDGRRPTTGPGFRGLHLGGSGVGARRCDHRQCKERKREPCLHGVSHRRAPARRGGMRRETDLVPPAGVCQRRPQRAVRT